INTKTHWLANASSRRKYAIDGRRSDSPPAMFAQDHDLDETDFVFEIGHENPSGILTVHGDDAALDLRSTDAGGLPACRVLGFEQVFSYRLRPRPRHQLFGERLDDQP